MAVLTGEPSWLKTPNFLGAMEAGTSAGQRERAQRSSESEAADRLRLAYDSLASHERMQSEAAQRKLEMSQMAQENAHERASAALDLKRAQMGALQAYRTAEEKRKQDALDMRGQYQGANLDLRQQGLDAREQQVNSMNEMAKARLDLAQERAKNSDTLTETIPAVDASPAMPAIPAEHHWFRKDQPFVPAQPAIPGHGEFKRTRHVPPGSSAADALKGDVSDTDNIPEFDTEEEALKAGVKGIVIINGRKARID